MLEGKSRGGFKLLSPLGSPVYQHLPWRAHHWWQGWNKPVCPGWCEKASSELCGGFVLPCSLLEGSKSAPPAGSATLSLGSPGQGVLGSFIASVAVSSSPILPLPSHLYSRVFVPSLLVSLLRGTAHLESPWHRSACGLICCSTHPGMSGYCPSNRVLCPTAKSQ